jgi:hypothetical protein
VHKVPVQETRILLLYTLKLRKYTADTSKLGQVLTALASPTRGQATSIPDSVKEPAAVPHAQSPTAAPTVCGSTFPRGWLAMGWV